MGLAETPKRKMIAPRSDSCFLAQAGKHLKARGGPWKQMEYGTTDCGSGKQNSVSIMTVILK